MTVEIIGFLSLLVAVGGLFVRTERRMSQIESRLARLEATMEPFWDLVRSNLPRLLVPEDRGGVSSENPLPGPLNRLKKEIKETQDIARLAGLALLYGAIQGYGKGEKSGGTKK